MPYASQVQRLQKLYIADERRWRRHVMSLPPSAAILEPLDTMTWSSTRNGYDAKLFSVAEISDDLMTLIQTVSIRERWPGDYDWTVADEVTIPSISPVYAVSAAHVIASFAATAVTIVNGAGAKRPAVRLTWDGANLTDLKGIKYQMRQLDEAYAETYGIGLARPSVIMDYQAQVYCLDSEGFRTDFPAAPGASVLLDYRHELYAMDLAWADPAYLKVYWRGHINDYTAGEKLISDGVLNSTTYQARIRPLAAWPTDWTAWETVTTGAEYV